MRQNMKDSKISLAGRSGLGRSIGNSNSNMSRRTTTAATSAVTVPGKRIPSTNLSNIVVGSTATTTTATIASTNDINHPAVVASLQSSSLIGKQLSPNNSATNSTKTSSPSTATPITPSIAAPNSNNNPSYNSMALSPCRQYGALAYKDTIQIIQITPQDGIVLLYIFPVTPFFQQQQQLQSQSQQIQQQQQQQQKYTPIEVTINRYNTSTGSSHATTISRTGSISTAASTSTNFLNLRDFALGSVNHRNSNIPTGSNSNNTTNMSMQQGVAAMDVTITHLAWSRGSNTVLPKQQSDNFRSDQITTPSNNNNNSERTADSDSTSHRREYDLDETYHSNGNNVNSYSNDDEDMKKVQQEYALRASMIAAAGSNGMIVVWNVGALFQSMGILSVPSALSNQTSTTTNISQQSKSPLSMQSTTLVTTKPLAILHHHTRQVNTLRWHPTRDGVLLSGSQDWTVILWERRKVVCEPDSNSVISIRSNDSSSTNMNMNSLSMTQGQQQQQGIKGFFSGFGNSNSSNKQKPNVNGSQQQYRSQQQQQPIMQQQQTYQWHCRTIYSPKSEAIREVKWSPFYLDVFALVTTSGSLIVYHQDISARTIIRTTAHSGDASTLDWHPTRRNVLATGGDRSVKIWDFEREFERELSSVHHLNFSKDEILSNMERNANTGTSRGESIGTNDSSTVAGTESPFVTVGASATYGARTLSSVSSGGNLSQRRKFNILHVLSISASVSRIRWRPVANTTARDGEDRHDAMIAVATAPIKGTSAGGAGTLSLWSFHRPYMPLSVVEGHRDGTVVDFDWLDTPQPSYGVRVHTNFHFGDLSLYETSGPAQLWQHIISIGRDGHCLIQSLVRGDRPISRVPSTCFAMANLSPFQKGYGSLQLFSVCQPVPSGPDADVLLTGLRRDIVTANAPGIFREPSDDSGNTGEVTSVKWRTGARIPEESPKIVFNVIDQGDLDDDSNPIDDAYGFGPKQIIVAPEVVHLSRFAERYKMYTDSDCPTRSALCQHNAEAADSMSQSELANMWRILSMILESCALHDNGEANNSDLSVTNEMMRTVYLPSVKELLEERADAGDVQTCVVICEIFEMIRPDQTLLISTLPIELIREWYLSYIDLLRDMCLFSHATYLIKNCHDPFIGALNQQSTTIYEACQNCGKEISNDVDNSKGDAMSKSISHRKCKRCRNRVGFCFICHEPVKGVYVWCPGCGHGGHLDHALQWFGSSNNSGDVDKSNVLRNMCPTGCGHLCNSLREVSAFPRTESFL